MKIVVFHGSPRKGNTFHAVSCFMNRLSECGDVSYTEFFLPKALPVFCMGCAACLGSSRENCPHAEYVTPILEAVLAADALVFALPHYGASAMPGGMKTLLDHLDFLVLNAAPRTELFDKKAFILTTGAGSASAIKPLKKFLMHCGVNRVYSLGIRLFTDRWAGMPKKKQKKYETAIRRTAERFYRARKKRPYLSSVFYFYMTRYVLKKYVGEGNYPYEYWKGNGFFHKRPF